MKKHVLQTAEIPLTRRRTLVSPKISRVALAFCSVMSLFTILSQTSFAAEKLFTTVYLDAGGNTVPPANSVAARASSLTIVPTFDSSVTSHPQSANIQAAINAAIAVYQARIMTPVVVSIKFQTMNTGLGASSTYRVTKPYKEYRSFLLGHATSVDAMNSLQAVPPGSFNPVNSDLNMYLPTALGRAAGYFDSFPPMGSPDSTIGLNVDICNIAPTDNDPSKYSLSAVVSHEIDEALGFGSALNGLHNGDPTPTGPIYPEDLFRVDQDGVRSFNTNANMSAYFTTKVGYPSSLSLARFNQDENGDFADWYSPGGPFPQVQDAFTSPGTHATLGVEFRVLDVLGYQVKSPPPPNLVPLDGYDFQTIPTTAQVGAPLTIGVYGYNKGSGASAACHVGFYLSPSSNSAISFLIGKASLGALDVARGAYATLSENCPAVAPGSYNLHWVIDVDNEVTETNELDNYTTGSYPVTISAAAQKLSFASLPSAFPSTVAVGAPVSFSAVASDGSNNPVTYSWDFGDGTTALGATVTKSYSAAGIYVATVTAANGTDSASYDLSVTVTAAPILGVVAMLKFDFVHAGKDSLTLTGALPLGAGFVPGGLTANLSIGDFSQTFPLNSKGISSSRNSMFALKGKLSHGALTGDTATFVLKVKNQDLYGAFGSGLGLAKTGTSSVSLPVLLTVGDSAYQSNAIINYSANNKTGSGNLP